jgi:hypothetical protein
MTMPLDLEPQLDFTDEFSAAETNQGTVPPVGIHRGIAFPIYQQWRAINSGVGKWLGVSMLHGHCALNGQISSDDTTSRKFGHATHKRVLEPLEYAAELLVSEQCSAITAKGTRCSNAGYKLKDGNWYCGTKSHAPSDATEPKDAVTAEEAERIERIAERLHSHFAITDCLRAKGFSEVSIAWEYLGQMMKGRIDRLETDNEFIIDLKKVQQGKGTKRDCRAAIEKWAYHRQAAMYVRGIETLTGIRPRFYWVFVEEKVPFDVNVLMAKDIDIEIGWREITDVVSAYAGCVKRGEFPGYIKSIEAMRDEVTGNAGGLTDRYIENAQRGL